MSTHRHLITVLGLLVVLLTGRAHAVELQSDWKTVLKEAQEQTVYFYAWGGSERINRYLAWAGNRLKADYAVELKHVKVGDIAEVVGQLEAARVAGRNAAGNVDLMWVNGENFAAMKRTGLTWGPFASALPNSQFVHDSPSIKTDFSVPVDSLESPWGGAQLVFIYDTQTVSEPPRSAEEFLAFVKAGGRFTYPAPPAFHGTTFLKQLLIELNAADTSLDALAEPVNDIAFEKLADPLWQYLDKLHPGLHGKGKTWPVNGESLRQMLDDGELDIALSFNPNDASAAVRSGQLPDTVRTYVFDNGTIGNTHFVTIPWNSHAKAGAMVVANFLLSPEAQAYKADPAVWGDPTVLELEKLDEKDKTLFDKIDIGIWSLPIGSGKVLSEPHASWSEALESAWIKRYGQ